MYVKMPLKVKGSAQILIIGPPNAGKSTIAGYLASKGDNFVKQPPRAMGVDITTFIFMSTRTSLIEVHSTYKEILNIYLSKTDGVIFVFDVTRPKEAKLLFEETITQLRSLSSGCLLIFANKTDKLEEDFNFEKYSQELNLEKLSVETDISWLLLPCSTKKCVSEIFDGFEWLTSRIAQNQWDTGDLSPISLKGAYLLQKGVGVPLSVKIFDKTFLADNDDGGTAGSKEVRQAAHLGGLLTAFSQMGETLFATSTTNEIRFSDFKLIFVANKVLLGVAVVRINDSTLRTRIILHQLLEAVGDPGERPISGNFILEFIQNKFPKDLPETFIN